MELPSRYRVLRRLGRGAQGTVLLATDRLRDDAPVAVKLVPCRLDDIREEFLTLSRLSHPNITRVHDYGRAGAGGAYFTSDFVDGGNLLDAAAELPAAERGKWLLRIAAQALSALAYLAHHGVRHGDIKPANLLVEAGPDPASAALRLIDFGAAGAPGRGVTLGTPAYAPPPALRGGERAACADLYALGMALYHAAAGRLPYRLGDPEDLERWWARREPASLRGQERDIPPVLDTLVARLTSPDPAGGFDGAADALEFLRESVSLPAREPARIDPGLWLPLREPLLSALTRATCEAPKRPQMVIGPPGSGVVAVLEALAPRLQVEGVETVLFRGEEDPRAWNELELIAGLRVRRDDGAAARRASAEDEAAALSAALRDRAVAILVDDTTAAAVESAGDAEPVDRVAGRVADPSATGGRGAALMRQLVTRPPGAAPGPVVVVATTARARWLERVGVPIDLWDCRYLEGVDEHDAALVARRFFLVDSVPEALARWLVSGTAGRSTAVLARLAALRDVGIRADFLGHLELPASLPEVPPADDLAAAAARLGAEERGALGRLQIAGEPLAPAELAERFGGLRVARWGAVLEDLAARGWCRRCRARGEVRYEMPPAAVLATVRWLSESEEHQSRSALREHYRRRPVVSGVETRLGEIRNELALGDALAAARVAARVAGALLRRRLTAELVEIFVQLGGPAGLPAGLGDAELALRLRAARAYDALGRPAAVTRALATPAEDPPRWFVRLAARLTADALGASGDTAGAASALERVLEGERHLAASGESSAVARSECEARLVPLLERCGRGDEARALLAGSDGCESLVTRLPAGLRELVGARVLGLWGAAHAEVGDPGRAAALLEASLPLGETAAGSARARTALNELGIVYVRARRWREAFEVFARLERAATERADALTALRAVYNQAVTRYRLAEFEAAESLFARARSLADELGSHPFCATVRIGFAGVLRERGRLRRALRLYRRVLRLRAGVRPEDRVLALNNLGEIYLEAGRLGSALQRSREAMDAARAIGGRSLPVLTSCLYGTVCWAAGRREEAVRVLDDAVSRAVDGGDPRAVGYTLLARGRADVWTRDSTRAIPRLRRAVRTCRAAGDATHGRLAELLLLWVLVSRGRTRTARRRLEKTREGRFAAAGAGRGDVLVAAVGWLVRGEPDRQALAESCERAVTEGHGWEAFQALRAALDGRRAAGVDRDIEELRLVEEGLRARIARSLPAGERDEFLAAWTGYAPVFGGGEPSAAGGAGSVGAATSMATGEEAEVEDLSVLAAVDEWLVAGGGLLELAKVLRRKLGVQALVVMAGEAGDLRPLAVAPAGADPGAALAAARDLAARTDGTPVRDCWRLPGTTPPAWVWFAGAAAGGGGTLEMVAVALALALRLERAVAADEQSARALEEARGEVRRLHGAITRDRSDLDTALITRRLELRQIESGRESQAPPGRRLDGESPAITRLVDDLPAIARERLPVLIIGESGVGKDLLARWIHALGSTRDRPWFAEVCNLNPALLEAELFGYARGAFTDALDDRPGIFQLVAGGTIYLDEVADMDPALQGKILRVIEDRQVRPVGGDHLIEVDFRVISSSRTSRAALENGGVLRRDLYYRLGAIVVEIPPLRERQDDIPLLVDAILNELTSQRGQRRPYVHPEAVGILCEHSWPGNVRELENELQRLILREPHEITPDAVAHLIAAAEEDAEPDASALPTLRDAREQTERSLIRRAFVAHHGNVSAAARSLGVTRRHLSDLASRRGLDPRHFRPPRASAGPPAADRDGT